MASTDDTLGSLPDPNVFSRMCSSRDVFHHVTGRWGALVIVALSENGEPMRFSELRRQVDGVSDRMLSQTLAQLEREGVVVRTVHSSIPPHVDYQLTELGNKLSGPLSDLKGIVERELGGILQSQEAYDKAHA